MEYRLYAISVALAVMVLALAREAQPQSKTGELEYEEQVSVTVLEPTVRKWLRGEAIWSIFTDVSDESIRKISGKERSQLTEAEAARFSDFRYEPALIDLNKDGIKELLIRNNCAPVGNCQLWIFRKTAKAYETILRTLPAAVQTYKLNAASTRGYLDLETRDHFDAFSGGITVYKFSGKEYRPVSCFTYKGSYLKNGKLHTLTRPVITTKSC